MSERQASAGDPFAKLESIYERTIQQQNWPQAVQIRAQAATLAQLRGRTDLVQRYFQEAIDLASGHDLQSLELGQRILCFSCLLNSDLTGQILDRLRGELRCELLPTGAADLKGTIIDRLEFYASSALAAYASLLQSRDQSLDALRESLRLARVKALAFSLTYLAGQFQDALDLLDKEQSTSAELCERIQAIGVNASAETTRIYDSLRVDVFLLAANFEHKRGNGLTRDDLLDRTGQLAGKTPELQVKVYMARADYCTGKKAIDYAKLAVEASEQVSFAALKSQAAAKLNELLAHGNPGQLSEAPLPGAGATDRVLTIVNSALQALQDRRVDDSLSLAGKALEQASSPQLRRTVLRVRATAFYELGRFTEAETDIDECISLLESELAADRDVGAGGFDSRIPEEESLYLVKAFLKARAGRNVEAWEAAEQGRSGRLKREIGGSEKFPADFDSMRQWLNARRAAILSFGPTRWGTLALTAGPDDAEPQSRILDCTSGNIQRMLSLDSDPESPVSDDIILDSIPGLSAALIHPLLGRLQDITQGARVLYIVPDSDLYSAPFAALALDGSPNARMLIDLCPLAIAPSAAVLLWCASRSSPSPARDCIAVAEGESEGIEFRHDLPRIAAAPWPQPPIELAGEAATPARVTAEAPRYSVVYLSCHGSVAQSIRDLMAASYLELAGRFRLSARDVLAWRMHAELVFLNACVAGRFRLEARTDVNGFVKAFMLAGARSLIAPLIHVDPRMAGDLAESFFQAWLSGATKAEALRTAQRAVRDKYPDKGWATYWLVWDFI